MTLGFWDIRRTQVEVVEFLCETYPDLQPLTHRTAYKVDKQFTELSNFTETPQLVEDTREIDIILSIDENLKASSRQISNEHKSVIQHSRDVLIKQKLYSY